MAGPLTGIRIVEFAGIGPGPYAGMLLADLGAAVIRVDRVAEGDSLPLGAELFGRGKRAIGVDLKSVPGREVALRLVAASDGLIEGFRPGVMERLGLGPDECLHRNPRLVYARMTGWGQTGPLSERAGHDIDYVAVSGGLHPIGEQDRPVPPLNLVGDLGGGGMFLVVGLLAALLEGRESGKGQVIDVAMVDGVAHLTTMVHSMLAAGVWSPKRRSNLLDGGAPFYDTYETADGNHMAVGALEPDFYAEMLEVLGLAERDLPDQYDRSRWGELRQVLAEVFRSRTRDEWAEAFEGTDACVAPVMSVVEAPHHPHLRARATFVDRDGVTQPVAAPRFSRTNLDEPGLPPRPGEDTEELLGFLGYEDPDIGTLLRSGTVK